MPDQFGNPSLQELQSAMDTLVAAYPFIGPYIDQNRMIKPPGNNVNILAMTKIFVANPSNYLAVKLAGEISGTIYSCLYQ